MSRRTVLLGGAGCALAAVAGAAASSSRLRHEVLRRASSTNPSAGLPDAPEGQVRLETVRSMARGRDVGLWTAVPAGHGDGRGLPICLVLHSASATTADFRRFGFARFLSSAVAAGVPAFVLAGADGGRTSWLGQGPGSADDPQAMLANELPRWCEERGFDSSRLAAYGWSMGGFGALRTAELRPGAWRAVTALSPAVAEGDAVFEDARRLNPSRTALWCGQSDRFFPAVQALADALPRPPAVNAHAPGGYTRAFWNSVTPAAFSFLGGHLAVSGPSAWIGEIWRVKLTFSLVPRAGRRDVATTCRNLVVPQREGPASRLAGAARPVRCPAHFALNGPDYDRHTERASMIRRYIAWRNRHADPSRHHSFEHEAAAADVHLLATARTLRPACWSCTPQPSTAKMVAMREHAEFQVDGGRLSADRWVGAGPLMVLLHAGVADRRSWYAVADRIADFGTVLAYDRRGFGDSPPQQSAFPTPG